jgi:hypothetical protein
MGTSTVQAGNWQAESTKYHCRRIVILVLVGSVGHSNDAFFRFCTTRLHGAFRGVAEPPKMSNRQLCSVSFAFVSR